MNSPKNSIGNWEGLNPKPREPGSVTEWCHPAVAVLLGVGSLLIVYFMTSSNRQTTKNDFDTLIAFGLGCAMLASVPMMVYGIAVTTMVKYQQSTGVWVNHPGATKAAGIGLMTPWIIVFTLILSPLVCVGFFILIFILSAING